MATAKMLHDAMKCRTAMAPQMSVPAHARSVQLNMEHTHAFIFETAHKPKISTDMIPEPPTCRDLIPGSYVCARLPKSPPTARAQRARLTTRPHPRAPEPRRISADSKSVRRSTRAVAESTRTLRQKPRRRGSWGCTCQLDAARI